MPKPDNPCQCFSVPVPGKPGHYESCDRLTKGRFAPGHDAKLKGILIKHAVNGEPLYFVDGGKATKVDPVKKAAELGWSHFVEKAQAKAAEKAAKAAERESAKAAEKASKPAKTKAPAKATKAPAKEKATKAPAKPRGRKTPAKSGDPLGEAAAVS